MRRLGGAAAAAGVLLLLLLTGCGSQATGPTASPTVTVVETPSATPSTSAAPTATATPSVSSSPTSSSSGGTSADSGRPDDQCANGDLGVSIVPASDGGAAGSQYFEVLFTNTGGSGCQLRGTPGVSVVTAAGAQLGEPADRLQSDVTTLRLAVGQSVAAPLKVVNIRDGGGPIGSTCQVQRGDAWRVYPPHSTKAFLVRSPVPYACTSSSIFMTASPVARYGG